MQIPTPPGSTHVVAATLSAIANMQIDRITGIICLCMEATAEIVLSTFHKKTTKSGPTKTRLARQVPPSLCMLPIHYYIMISEM